MPVNIEFKAHCAHPEYVRNLLQKMGATFAGTDEQIDTYFNVSTGRLKLRRGNIENNLIYYERSDANRPRRSDVRLVRVTEPSILLGVLSHALGVHCVVAKRREIYFHDETKIHLDSLPTIGNFVEVEVISSLESPNEEEMQKTCRSWMRKLNITANDLVSASYADMINAL